MADAKGDMLPTLITGTVGPVQIYENRPVPEETFTHSHLSWSSIISYLLHPSTTVHGILPVQSACLTVFFHNLSPSFIWSTFWPGTLQSTVDQMWSRISTKICSNYTDNEKKWSQAYYHDSFIQKRSVQICTYGIHWSHMIC